MLAEIRAYGEGVVIAEQIPAKLVPDAIKNTALKVLHRLPAADDSQLVGATMNLDADQSRQVVSMPPGEAAELLDVPGVEGRAHRGDHLADARLMGHHHVGVTLDHRNVAGLGRGVAGQVDAVQVLTLTEQRRVG